MFSLKVVGYLHFHLAGLFVVAEGAIELLIQRHDCLLFRLWLSLGLSTTHIREIDENMFASRQSCCLQLGCQIDGALLSNGLLWFLFRHVPDRRKWK